MPARRTSAKLRAVARSIEACIPVHSAFDRSRSPVYGGSQPTCNGRVFCNSLAHSQQCQTGDTQPSSFDRLLADRMTATSI